MDIDECNGDGTALNDCDNNQFQNTQVRDTTHTHSFFRGIVDIFAAFWEP